MLPRGLGVGGVNVWAMRLARGMARAGRPVTIVAHPDEPGHTEMAGWLYPGVRLVRLCGVPPIDACAGDLTPMIATYRAEAERIWGLTGRPAALLPSLHGDCYGACAAIAQGMGDRVRVIGVCHSSLPYDRVVIERYEPALSRIVAVSDTIERELKAALPGRAHDFVNLAHGVESPDRCPVRKPGAGRARPLRLIYTGRMEHGLKRVSALVALSRELDRRGVEHHLALVGDGPAAGEIDAMLEDAPHASRAGSLAPDRVGAVLREADVFVLASRVEGLSVSMLEAMGQGCVPVCTPTRSGASQLVMPGITGELAEVEDPEGASDEEVAGAMADAIERLLAGAGDCSIQAIGERAWALVQQRYSLAGHANAFMRVLDDAAREPARWWPADRACAFTRSGAGTTESATVPGDAMTRMRAVLRSLAGKRVAILGTGQHTLALGPAIAETPEVVGFIDDDRGRQGRRLWGWWVVGPEAATEPRPKGLGATDVVISSWMHEEAIWARRGFYESRGVRVHRLYGEPSQASGQRISSMDAA